MAVLSLGVVMAPSALASQTLGGRVLREGMSGSDVLTLQRLLNKIGINAPTTGRFDAATETQVLSFENKYGLVQNGLITVADVNELRRVVNLQSPTGGVSTGALTPSSANSNSTSTYSGGGPPALKAGASGRWVAVLQQDLTYAGYNTGVDGQWGSSTTRSVNSFKQSHGLALNGTFGRKAWAVLQTALKAVESSVPAAGTARLNSDGTVTAPSNAPAAVQEMIAAANQIATKPYIYGGGHASFIATGYDCSGSVSYVLHAAGLLTAPEDSGELESFGVAGPGQWVTIYADAGHVYMEIAGLWFDTAAQSWSNGENRWSASRISPVSGYTVRHVLGM